jgi:hypothetical protein
MYASGGRQVGWFFSVALIFLFYEVYSVGCVDVVDELIKDRLFRAFESEPTFDMSIYGLPA